MKPRIPAISCKQWLPEWNNYPFKTENFRTKPEEQLYLFSMSARQLRKLSGVFKRERTGLSATGIQRLHEKARSAKIAEYVRAGYPFGDLNAKQKADPANSTLKKPGWLPTAIVVNFLTQGTERRGVSVHSDDVLQIESERGRLEIVLPENSNEPDWKPSTLAPIEIIDGQHRLFAFDETSELPDDFELPVVAFHGLDIGWQAYLFWSINVSPKKINPSHAYDLFPLLRTQDWLETVSSVHVYREARAQELTELLFRHPASPWHGRINMLGERKSGFVSQASWVQAIFNTFLAPGGRSNKGLFATNLSSTKGPLDWTRPQQAAVLIYIWASIRVAVEQKNDDWTVPLRKAADLADAATDYDLAFEGPNTLLNQEQGVRGINRVLNDLLYREAESLELEAWRTDDIDVGETRNEDIDRCLEELKGQRFAKEIELVASAIADFDWRSSNAPDLTSEESIRKAAFRGTGGYGLMRVELLAKLSTLNSQLGEAAGQILASEKAV